MKIIFSFIFCFLFALGMAKYFHVGINITPSLSRGIYIKAEQNPITHGDIVSFCLDEEKARFTNAERYVDKGFCEHEILPLLKIVVGMNGDKIEIKENRVFITRKNMEEAVFYGIIKEFDSFGDSIPSLLEEGIIPQNKVYVYADHEGSYDSRYYGLIELDKLTKMKELIKF